MTRSATAAATAAVYSRARSAPATAHPRRLPVDPIVKNLGCRLLALRCGAGMTQHALSTRSGLDRSFISDMERGIKSCNIITLHTLAQTYKITLAELFAGVETI